MTSFGATRARDQHGADDEVGLLDRRRDLEARAHQQRHAAREHLLEVAHAVDRALEDRHLRAEPERDHGRVVADHAAADDHDLAGRDAGDAAQQQPAAAHRLLEEVRTRLRREAPRDLRHRRQERQRAAHLDGLVGDRGDARVDQRARERLVGRDVQVREEDQSLAEPLVLRLDRLLHLQDHVGAPPDVVDRRDARAHALVRVVAERAADARARLDQHFVPGVDQLECAGGGERDPVLVRLDLFGDPDPHAARKPTVAAGAGGPRASSRPRPSRAAPERPPGRRERSPAARRRRARARPRRGRRRGTRA